MLNSRCYINARVTSRMEFDLIESLLSGLFKDCQETKLNSNYSVWTVLVASLAWSHYTVSIDLIQHRPLVYLILQIGSSFLVRRIYS